MRKRKTASRSDELPVGRVAGLFGVQGELKCGPTDAGRMLFLPGETFRSVSPGGNSRSVNLQSVREHKGRLLVRFEGVESAAQAKPFTGATLYARRDRIVLQRGEYLDQDLLGCRLYDGSGRDLGTVERVDHYPASAMLVVRGKLVPFVEAFICSVDAPGKRIEVDLPAGLLEDEAP